VDLQCVGSMKHPRINIKNRTALLPSIVIFTIQGVSPDQRLMYVYMFDYGMLAARLIYICERMYLYRARSNKPIQYLDPLAASSYRS